jgi:D-alanyl-D-alanine carboxypeptidase
MKKSFILFLLLVLALSSHAQDDIEDALQDLLEEYVDDDEPGVVLYIHYDGDEWLVAAGSADLERETPMQVDDLFRLASITKPFVATVVLQLVSEGEFDLDDPIADYLPDEIVENVENADEATIRQVLQMTSGIHNYTDTDAYYEVLEEMPDYALRPEDALELIYDEDAYFDVGEDWYYSNSNYLLAQLLIEDVTGNLLAEEIEDRVFEPLGMDSCYMESFEELGENIVHGYEYWDVEYSDVTYDNDFPGLGDMGSVCNAEDLAIFLPALLDGELLDDDMLEEMFDVLEDGEGESYGLGIMAEEDVYGWEIWHDGAGGGFQSLMDYLYDEDMIVVILTNYFDSEIVEDLFYDAVDTVLDE